MAPARESVYAIILAGGSGTRLWPLSCAAVPKQLLKLFGNESLLQQTARRLLGYLPADHVVTVTQKVHASETRHQLQTIDPALLRLFLVEPEGRNTLPAIAWAVATILQEDPRALIGVFPADHLIQDSSRFHQALNAAFKAAQQGYLVTMGIPPLEPATGFGYIRKGAPLPAGSAGSTATAFQIASFTEKPDRKTAEAFLREGSSYYWNAGIFVFSAVTFQSELERIQPEVYRMIQRWSHEESIPYTALPSLSIDYGIMEKTDRAAVIPTDVSWSDVGNWEAVYKQTDKDPEGNVLQGDAIALDCRDSLLIARDGFLAAIGLKNAAVIQTEEATLVAPLNRTNEVKQIVERLKEKKSEDRPWGSFTILEEGTGYKIKRIRVNPGQKLSLQRHRQRSEHWVVTEGTAKVVNDKREIALKINESTFIPQGTKHRLENPGTTPLTIIEVQVGSYLGEDDIERLEDLYDRVAK